VSTDPRRVQSVFLAAAEQPSPEARAAYLDQACGDDAALRRRVEELLRAHDDPGGFLSGPAVRLAAGAPGAKSHATDTQGGSAGDGAAAEPLAFLGPPGRPGSLGRLGHYEVLEVVGRGGMGVVLKALDEKLQRVVAIKVMAPQLATSAGARQRFVREAQAAAAVRDEHVVDIHAVEEANGLPYLVMEYVAGVSLQERLDRTGPLQLKEVLRIGMQAAVGLAAAHKQGLVHRDVKPANILLENGVERVKLTDFGLARAVADASLTQSGVVAGTPPYMAPEQAEGRPMDHRGDLFSLGSVLYALCTGRPPFWADSAVAILKRVCEDTPRPIRDLNPDVPPWLVEIIARLHAKVPAQRFASAAEVADLLGRRLAELQQPPDGTVPAGPPVRPRRHRWAILVAAVLVLAGGLTLAAVIGVTRVVPALRRAVHGPAGGDAVAVSRPDRAPAVEPPRNDPPVEPKVDSPAVPVEIPVPQLAYQGQEDSGDFTYHRLTIINSAAFPDALFQASPDLPAVGSNKAAARTMVYVCDAKDGRRLNGYSAVPGARFLNDLQFWHKKGDPAPRQVYVLFEDRKLWHQSRSNLVTVAERRPFVILGRAGRAEQKVDTLAEAVRLARDGDTIEVRADGPFAPPADPIVLPGYGVRIRAGAGFRPVFHVYPPEGEKGEAGDLIITSTSPLVLEGLDFHQAGPAARPGAGRHAVILAKGPLFVANCRFAVKSHAGVGVLSLSGAPQGEVRNCQLLAPTGVGLTCSSSGRAARTVLRNNVIVSPMRPLYVQFSVGEADADLRLTRNTFVGAPPVFTQPNRQPNAPPDPGTGPPMSLRVEASGNIFDGRAEAVHMWFQKRAEKPAELIQQRAGWKGDHNLFAADACLSVRAAMDQPVVLGARLADWRRFWGDPETGSVEGRPRYLGGDVVAQGSAAPERLTPEDLRLHPESPGRGAGPDGQDLGADVDLVGPGAAYERWQKTPDYQEWLKVKGRAK
jgi:hypothetical protein